MNESLKAIAELSIENNIFLDKNFSEEIKKYTNDKNYNNESLIAIAELSIENNIFLEESFSEDIKKYLE